MTATDTQPDRESLAQWRCPCGNDPTQDGFYPVDAAGRLVEPTPEDWRTNEYGCARCGRVFDALTQKVTRRVAVPLVAVDDPVRDGTPWP